MERNIKRGRNTKVLWAVIATAAVAGTLSSNAWAAYIPPAPTAQAITQPQLPVQHSSLIGFNFAANAKPVDGVNIVYDSTFANWINLALTKGGVSQVGNATFLFNQCFGGGFLDDVDRALSPSLVNWVGGAASRYDQPSYGQALTAATPNPMSFWTTVMAPGLIAGSQNASTIDTANATDPMKAIESGQLYYPPGGGTVPLTGGVKKYALLWAGLTDAQRHYNNTNAVYTQLVAAGYTVTVLYGNGATQVPLNTSGEMNNAAVNPAWNAQIATPATLQGAIANIGAMIQNDKANGMNDDQFLFYATDHGGNTDVVGVGAGGGLIPGAGGPQGSYGTIQISPGQNAGSKGDSVAVPTLTIDYDMSMAGDGPGEDAEVLLNGVDIGDILYDPSNPANASATLAVPKSDLIDGSDTLAFQTVSGGAFDILDASYFTGAVDELVVVPEPGTLVCMGIGMGALVMRRRARRA